MYTVLVRKKKKGNFFKNAFFFTFRFISRGFVVQVLKETLV